MTASIALHLRAWLTAAGLALDPFGYSGGLTAVVLDDRPGSTGGWMASADCGDCHTREHRSWTDSRHHRAFTNDRFQAGLILEPRAFCVNCHAPTAPQVAEVLPNLPAYATLAPGWSGGVRPPLSPEPRAADGVGCAACHLRNGEVLAARLTPAQARAPHPVRVEPTFGTAAACRGCHQFLADTPTAKARWWMQSTWAEWQQITSKGEPDCIDCHMKEGDHAMTGAADLTRLKSALRVEVDQAGLLLEARALGHRLPTGDLFRAITVEWARSDAAPAASSSEDGWTVAFRAGRTFRIEPVGGTSSAPHGVQKTEVSDTRLWPGVPVYVDLPAGAQWRVRYHYGAPHDVAVGLAPPDAWRTTLFHGTLPTSR